MRIDRISYRDSTPADQNALQGLFVDTFGFERTARHLEWWIDGPAGPARSYVAELDGQVVGHWGVLPRDGWIDGRPARFALGFDAMVAPAHQRAGLIQRLLHQLPRDGFDARLSFPEAPVARVLERSGGTRLGLMPLWGKWCGRDALAVKLPTSMRGAFAAGILAAQRLSEIGGTAGYEITDITAFGPEFDQLAERAAHIASCSLRRDAASLTWRWIDPPGHEWRVRAARRGGELVGYAVSGVRVHHGPRVGVIGDIVALDPRTQRALLVDASRILRESACEAIELRYLDPRRWSAAVLRSVGFRPWGAWRHAVAIPYTEDANAVVERRSWYLTFGDLEPDAEREH